jgi:predicted acylesterase/phospholipase RssA
MSIDLIWVAQLGISIVAGSAIGALIASEVSWRRTEKKVRRLIEMLSRDEKLKSEVKTLAKEFINSLIDELRSRAPEMQAMFMMRVGRAQELPKEIALVEKTKS